VCMRACVFVCECARARANVLGCLREKTHKTYTTIYKRNTLPLVITFK